MSIWMSEGHGLVHEPGALRADMLELIGHHYGGVTPLVENSVAPAERFQLPDGTVFGIIPSTTTPSAVPAIAVG